MDQAVGLPARRSAGQHLRDRNIAQKLNVEPPAVQTVTAGTVTVVALDKSGVCVRYIQNCGIPAIKYAINTDPSADVFHGVLAGGNAEDDGLGTGVDLSGFRGEVRLWSASNYRYSILDARGPEIFD